jgi:molybdopterin-binding protein
MITNAGADHLGLKKGMSAAAVVKASDAMSGVE